jgi:hypothetical protein
MNVKNLVITKMLSDETYQFRLQVHTAGRFKKIEQCIILEYDQVACKQFSQIGK